MKMFIPEFVLFILISIPTCKERRTTPRFDFWICLLYQPSYSFQRGIISFMLKHVAKVATDIFKCLINASRIF